MPRGRGRGGRHRKKGAGTGKRELVYKEEGQEYGQVSKLLGSGRMEVNCFDGKTRLAKVRGKFKRRVWVNVGDIILVNVREFDEGKGDIIHVYYYDEAKALKQVGELPSDTNITENKALEEGKEFDVEFEDEDQDAKKKTKVSEKQNLEDFMPSDSSDEEEEVKPKKKAPAQTKVIKEQTESESEEEEEKDSDESEEEYDELADI